MKRRFILLGISALIFGSVLLAYTLSDVMEYALYPPSYIASDDIMPSLDLTAEEAAWLEENDTIHVAFDPGWFPIEYADEEGNLSGVTLHYTSEFSRLTGADFAGVPAADSWNDALVMMQNGEADVMYMVASTPDRLEYMSFTTPHYTAEASIVTSTDRQATLEDEDLRLITLDGYSIESWLDEKPPQRGIHVRGQLCRGA